MADKPATSNRGGALHARGAWGTPTVLGCALVACVLGACSGHAVAAPGKPTGDHYWQLGVGSYFGGLGAITELDAARFDWLYLCYGNIGSTRETTELLNRLLAINPRLKIMIRVWPIMSKGDCKQNRYQATMWHYLYKPGVKKRVLEEIDRQVHIVLDHITKPKNVIGLTFLEELPGHFSACPVGRDKGVGWAMERFRKEIEAERGKPLVWDDDTRRWWGTKWVQVMGEIHARMKKASGGRLVFYYQATGYKSLDMVPKGTPLASPLLMPVSWKDIIKPGLCDGFFAYPNNATVWNRYVKLAKDNGWLLFSQLSHPSGMRLSPWKECLSLAKTRIPQNLGYFFYCGGQCAGDRAWNADPGIPPGRKWNTRGVSAKLHIRRHLAMEDVGMDVVRRHPPLGLQVDLPLAAAKPGGFLHMRVIVRNIREASFYLDPREAIARNVALALKVPPGFRFDPSHSPPPTLKLGDLGPGEYRVGNWWIAVDRDYAGKVSAPFVFTARAHGCPPVEVRTTKGLAIAFAQAHEIGIPGTQWLEAAFRLPREQSQVKPRIVIEGLGEPVRRPGVGDQFTTIRYDGVLQAGMKLVMDPFEGARLFLEPLVDDDGKDRADKKDPTGFKAFDKGYGVVGIGSRARVDPKVPLVVTISGKAEGGANSHLILRFVMRKKGTTRDVGTLTNRFKKTWRTTTAQVTVPPGAVSLQRVFLYRFRNKGKVWYGPVKVTRADADPKGVDVSDRLGGAFPSLCRWRIHMYHYTDDNPPSVRARARVQLRVPEPE